jgi:hypothetical protein
MIEMVLQWVFRLLGVAIVLGIIALIIAVIILYVIVIYRAVIKSDGTKKFSGIERTTATRYLKAKRNQGGVGLIAAISFICIMLAIAAMIIIMSIMNGFRSEVIRLTIGSQGHIYAELAEASPDIQDIREIESRLLELDGVKEAFQYTQDFTGVQANGVFGLGQVIGVRLENLEGFDLIANNINQGSLEGFGEGRGSRSDGRRPHHGLFPENQNDCDRPSTNSKELYRRSHILSRDYRCGSVLYLYGPR